MQNLIKSANPGNRILYLTAGISLIVLFTGLYTLTVKYIIPVYNKDIIFIHDFSFYQSAAERFLNNPSDLYKTTDLLKEVAFVYPPPAVFIFLPFAGAGLFNAYLIFLIISLGLLIAAIHFFIKSAEHLLNVSFLPVHKAIIYLIAAGNAPVYMNFQSSQVGTFLIFLTALFIYALVLKRNLISGAILSISILIKIYPALLVFGGLHQERRKKFLTGLLAGVFVIPLLSLLVIPLSVYKDFFFHILPGLGSYTETNVYNQSLIPVILRLAGLADGSWALMEIPPYLKLLNYLLFASIITFCAVKIYKSPLLTEQVLFVLVLLSSIPVFSTFGWGHLYIFSLPLLLVIMHKYKDTLWIIPLFLIFAIDIPDSAFSMTGLETDSFLFQAFHSRFPLAVLIMILRVISGKKTFLSEKL